MLDGTEKDVQRPRVEELRRQGKPERRATEKVDVVGEHGERCDERRERACGRVG